MGVPPVCLPARGRLRPEIGQRLMVIKAFGRATRRIPCIILPRFFIGKNSRILTVPGLLLGMCIALPASPLDVDRAKDIFGPCAGCHGELGAGGKNGEYPRIAGQKPKYLEQQLKSFQQRARVNIPMIPYTEERELSE